MKLVLNWMLSILAFIACGVQYSLASIGAGPVVCYANTIDSDLQLDLVLDSAMTALKQILTPLGLFSTAFRNVPLKGTNKMLVPYYPLETAASRDFNGTYQFDGTNTSKREVTINKRKYQGLAFTSEELARQPQFDPEKLGALKGMKLAEDVLADIWSQITLANYGAAIFTGAAGDFDVDDVIDHEATLTTAKWPKLGRGAILAPTYFAGLKKDMNANGGLATFGRDSNASGFPEMLGFKWSESNVIPANGENLVGMYVMPSAMLIGFSPITPAKAVRKNLVDYRVVTDPDVGLSLEYREWGDPDTDTEKRTIEVNYGYDVGEEAALKRLVSA